MKSVFKDNAELCKAWAYAHTSHGKNPRGTLSFGSLSVIDSYAMPIAWRTCRDKVIVRCSSESPSVTTSRHISVLRGFFPHKTPQNLINVPVTTLKDTWDIGITAIVDYDFQMQWLEHVTFIRDPENDTQRYTMFTVQGGYFDDTPLVCRRDVAFEFCVKGEDIPSPHALVRALVPPEHYKALIDGWVAYVGDLLLVGAPAVTTRSLSKDAPVVIREGAFSATDAREDYVRGVVSRHASRVFSSNMDGRPGADKVWHKTVKPLQLPLTASIGKALTAPANLLKFSRIL